MLNRLFLCAFFSALLMLGGSKVSAQNVQLHYDFGRHLYDKDYGERPLLTSTFEMFKADPWGSTFLFADIDYKQEGVASAYWEIVRELQFWKNPFSIHLEYNGGTSNQFSYQNAYLVGGTYTRNSSDFSRNFSVSASYKYIQKHPCPHNYQLTAAWYIHFVKDGLFTFSGFMDFWREKTYFSDGSHKNFIFLSEPQIWVNLNKVKGISEKFKMSIGSEVELSKNFAGREDFFAIPTLAVKWTFD